MAGTYTHEIDKHTKAITSIPGWYERLMGSDELSGTAASYAYVPLIYRALRLRCDSLSSVPLRLETPGGEEVPWPFKVLDPTDFVSRTEAALLLTGGAYWLKLMNRTTVVGLQYLNPFAVTVDWVPAKRDASGNVTEPGYRMFLYSDERGEVMATYPESMVIYFHEFHPTDDIQPGIGAAEVALQSAGLRRYATRFASYFFEGGAMPALLLGIPAGTPEAERQRVENYFQRFLTNVKNAWRVLAIRAGLVEPKVLTPPLKDMVIPELNALALEDICAAFGLRKSVLGDPANYATSVEDWDSFWRTTVRPRGRLFEGVLNRQLFNGKVNVRFMFEDLDVFQKSEAERADSVSTLADILIKLLDVMPDAQSAIAILEEGGYDLSEDTQTAVFAMFANRESEAAEEQQEQPREPDEQPEDDQSPEIEADLAKWRRKAIKRLPLTDPAEYDFTSEHIPAETHAAIMAKLAGATTEADIDAAFAIQPVRVDNSLAAELRRANDLMELALNA